MKGVKKGVLEGRTAEEGKERFYEREEKGKKGR